MFIILLVLTLVNYCNLFIYLFEKTKKYKKNKKIKRKIFFHSFANNLPNFQYSKIISHETPYADCYQLNATNIKKNLTALEMSCIKENNIDNKTLDKQVNFSF